MKLQPGSLKLSDDFDSDLSKGLSKSLESFNGPGDEVGEIKFPRKIGFWNIRENKFPQKFFGILFLHFLFTFLITGAIYYSGTSNSGHLHTTATSSIAASEESQTLKNLGSNSH